MDSAQNALQWEWGNFPFANWNGICWGLPLQLEQLIKLLFLPHLESFMWEQKFEKKFFKKDPIQPPNGALLIFKLPFPNGSYFNRVCRALRARTDPRLKSRMVTISHLQCICDFHSQVICNMAKSITTHMQSEICKKRNIIGNHCDLKLHKWKIIIVNIYT